MHLKYYCLILPSIHIGFYSAYLILMSETERAHDVNGGLGLLSGVVLLWWASRACTKKFSVQKHLAIFAFTMIMVTLSFVVPFLTEPDFDGHWARAAAPVFYALIYMCIWYVFFIPWRRAKRRAVVIFSCE